MKSWSKHKNNDWKMKKEKQEKIKDFFCYVLCVLVSSSSSLSISISFSYARCSVRFLHSIRQLWVACWKISSHINNVLQIYLWSFSLASCANAAPIAFINSYFAKLSVWWLLFISLHCFIVKWCYFIFQ